MNIPVTLRHARLIDATIDCPDSDITLDNTLIRSVRTKQEQTEQTEQGRLIDVPDALIMPGFIDVHTHGGGGFRLSTADEQEIHSYARWVTSTGVTSFLVGVVGVPASLPAQQLHTAVSAIHVIEREEQGEQGEQGERGEQGDVGGSAEILGIHLEGPYINPKRRGAHPLSWLRLPDVQETAMLLQLTQGRLRLVTLAPELPGSHALIQQLVEAGVTVSIGHTDATYEQAQNALQLGITHATHCFNAMPPLLHRAPGPIAAIAQAPQVYGEVIADGVHVHPSVVAMLVRMLSSERIIVVTDAQPLAGIAENGFSEFAGQRIHSEGGAALLGDGTLAGSVLTMDKALRSILSMTGVSLQEAVRMLTLNPAASVRVDGRKGRLKAGYDADLLLFDSTLTLQATICRGRIAFVTEAWRERISNLL